MNDEKSVTAGTKPRSRLSKLKTKFHTKRAVIRIVPISASNAAFLSVMIRSMNVCQCHPQLRLPPWGCWLVGSIVERLLRASANPREPKGRRTIVKNWSIVSIRKPFSNSSGSSAEKTRLKVSCDGMPPGNERSPLSRSNHWHHSKSPQSRSKESLPGDVPASVPLAGPAFLQNTSGDWPSPHLIPSQHNPHITIKMRLPCIQSKYN